LVHFDGLNDGRMLFPFFGPDRTDAAQAQRRPPSPHPEDVVQSAELDRPLEGDWPYLWLDATYLKQREGWRIVSVAAIIAVAANTEGKREVMGLHIGLGEAETFWATFLRSLVKRGLRGTKLVIPLRRPRRQVGRVRPVRPPPRPAAAWRRSPPACDARALSQSFPCYHRSFTFGGILLGAGQFNALAGYRSLRTSKQPPSSRVLHALEAGIVSKTR